MTPWLLPSAAAAFWAGVLLGRSGRPWAGLGPGLVFLAGVAILAAIVIRRSPGSATSAESEDTDGSSPLVVAGLVAEPPAAAQAISPRQERSAWSRPPLLRSGALLTGLLLLGFGWAGIRTNGVQTSLLARLAPGHVDVTGSLRSDPKPSQFGWSALVGVSQVSSAAGTADLRETVWVEGNPPMPVAERGDSVKISGVLLRPPPGGFADYLSSSGIAAELKADQFARIGPSSNPLVRLAGAARDALRSSIERLFAPREAGLLMGLALGDTSGLDPGVQRHFLATGLSHLLAVSGENVAMVLTPVLALCLLMQAPPRVRFSTGIATVVFFVVLTGAEPSVLRAGVMAVIAMAGVVMGRPRSSWTVLGAAVLVLLVLDPFLVSSIGFALSVAATVGMVTLASPLAERLGVLPKPIALALGTSIAAQIGVAPVLLFFFHWIPGVTLLANLLAFPAVAPALLLGLAAAAAGTIFHPAGWVLAHLALLPLRYLEILADRLASSPLPSITSSGSWPPLVAGAILLAALAWYLHGGRIPRAVVFAAVLVFPVFVWSTALGAGPPSGLEIHFFDVGQGDGALITSPGGANILVDAGPDPELVATKLASLGIKRLDAVVATHPHADHIEGLPEVFARFPVGVVFEPGCDEPSPSYTAFKESIRDETLQVRYPRTGDVIRVGDLTLSVLAPGGCFSGTHSDPNNDSIVFLLQYREDTVLFPGDAEVESQQVMLDDRAPVAAEVLKVPHHGGDTSLPEFFSAVHAQLAVVSVGQPNPYGHPVPKVLDELRATGAEVVRTDQSGDVDVTFRGGGLFVDSLAA